MGFWHFTDEYRYYSLRADEDAFIDNSGLWNEDTQSFYDEGYATNTGDKPYMRLRYGYCLNDTHYTRMSHGLLKFKIADHLIDPVNETVDLNSGSLDLTFLPDSGEALYGSNQFTIFGLESSSSYTWAEDTVVYADYVNIDHGYQAYQEYDYELQFEQVDGVKQPFTLHFYLPSDVMIHNIPTDVDGNYEEPSGMEIYNRWMDGSCLWSGWCPYVYVASKEYPEMDYHPRLNFRTKIMEWIPDTMDWTYYADGVTGLNTNTGKTSLQPWRQIDYTAENIPAFRHLYVKNDFLAEPYQGLLGPVNMPVTWHHWGTRSSRIMPGGSTNVRIATQDTSIVNWEGFEDSTNYGNAIGLQIDYGIYILAQFDTTGYTRPVQSAKLRLLCWNWGGDYRKRWISINAKRLLTTFNEATACWNNRPSTYNGDSVTTGATIGHGDWIEFDMTALFNNMSINTGTTFGVYLAQVSGDYSLYFRSKEVDTYGPQLVIIQ